MAPALDIESVSAGEEELLAGYSLSRPQPGDSAGGYALDVAGWVVGRHEAVETVEVVHEGRCLRSTAAEIDRPDVAAALDGYPWAARSGFFTTVNALRLRPNFEFELVAVLASGQRVLLSSLRGRRVELRTGWKPRLEPLLVTTIGRTGSTMLMGLLAGHPGIVAAEPFEYEPRVASYWMEVLMALGDPASHRRQMVGGPTERWWLGDQLSPPRPIRHPALRDWLGAESVRSLAEFCQSRIEALYDRIDRQGEDQPARYFAEKYWAASSLTELMIELYPGAREIVLVRDFRDMLCSMYAYDRKRGYVSFGRQNAQTDHQHVVELGGRVGRLLEAWERRREGAHLVRYEDLVREPKETLAAVLGYLDLDARESTLAGMRAALAASDDSGHRTTASAQDSIGRWHSDLSPELREASAEAFREALEAFGYSLEGNA